MLNKKVVIWHKLWSTHLYELLYYIIFSIGLWQAVQSSCNNVCFTQYGTKLLNLVRSTRLQLCRGLSFIGGESGETHRPVANY